MADPEIPSTSGAVQRVAHSNKAVTSNELNRVERLLAQVEAKSVALVPYGYWNQPQAQTTKSNTWAIATVLGGIWLSSLALVIVNLSYKHSSQIAESGVTTTPLVIHSPSDLQDQKTTESVGDLAKALVSSSHRLNRIEVTLEKSHQDLQQLEKRRNAEAMKMVPPKPEAISAEIKKIAVTAASSHPDATATGAPPSKSALDDASAETPYRVLSIKPTDAAIPHKAADGTITYWLVARGAFMELARVQPIAVTADGVVIHNLEDGKNYTLTRQGDWRDAEW